MNRAGRQPGSRNKTTEDAKLFFERVQKRLSKLHGSSLEQIAVKLLMSENEFVAKGVLHMLMEFRFTKPKQLIEATGDGFFFAGNISEARAEAMEASKPNGKAEGSS